MRTSVVFGLCDFGFCTDNQGLVLATNHFAAFTGRQSYSSK